MTKVQIRVLLALALLGCLVVFAGPRTNPDIQREVAWDSPQTEELFARACQDCHSHKTVWPWYSHVGPMSWLVIHDVEEAREEFNVSGAKLGEADEAAQHLREGKMPPAPYVMMHPEAKLTAVERQQLIDGLAATFGDKGGADDEGESGHD